MLPQSLVHSLCCPTCPSLQLSLEGARRQVDQIVEGRLVCSKCARDYPVENGIPNLLPVDSLSGEGWTRWETHLQGLQVRRSFRRRKPGLISSRKGELRKEFIRFTGIEEGNLLDVGCGSGDIQPYLDEERVTFVGLDPIPCLPEIQHFPYVRGMAEFLPFQSKFFSHVVVKAALDHFYELDRFLTEVRRVLHPGGSFHLLQSVHDVNDPGSALKMIAHRLKDLMDSKVTSSVGEDVPKHMAEFHKRDLFQLLRKHFRIVANEEYSDRWYSPRKLFLSMQPLA